MDTTLKDEALVKHLAVLVDGEVQFCGHVDSFAFHEGQAPELGAGALVFKATYPLKEKKKT